MTSNLNDRVDQVSNRLDYIKVNFNNRDIIEEELEEINKKKLNKNNMEQEVKKSRKENQQIAKTNRKGK